MERRRFILLSFTAAAVVAGCRSSQDAPGPGMLSSLCDEKTLHAIGRDYLQQHPAEKNRDVLKKLVLNKDVRHDFQTGNIVTIQGWVLSITEARQCALLTL